jgi:YggT family protein
MLPFFGHIIHGVAWVLDNILTVYLFIVIASAVISWVSPDPYNPIVRFLRNVTEPVYMYIRRYLPFVYIGGFDLSPIVLIVVIQFFKFAIVQNLFYLAVKLGSTIYR